MRAHAELSAWALWRDTLKKDPLGVARIRKFQQMLAAISGLVRRGPMRLSIPT